jgi:hypothetical protein
MEIEIWKDIPNYEGYYQASSLGRIRSIQRKIPYKTNKNIFCPVKNKILKQYNNHDGYLQISLNKKTQKTFKVHKLIALTFLGKSNLSVDHINGIKHDNKIINLQYLSNRDNCRKYNLENKENKTSKYLNICLPKRGSKYLVKTRYNKKNYNLGSFDNEIEAKEIIDLFNKGEIEKINLLQKKKFLEKKLEQKGVYFDRGYYKVIISNNKDIIYTKHHKNYSLARKDYEKFIINNINILFKPISEIERE